MFSGCNSLASVEILEKWNTENVNDMISMFNNTNIKSGPSNFKYSIDLSNNNAFLLDKNNQLQDFGKIKRLKNKVLIDDEDKILKNLQ